MMDHVIVSRVRLECHVINLVQTGFMAKNVKINVNAKTKVRAIKLTEDANVWENGREFTAIKNVIIRLMELTVRKIAIAKTIIH